jgi:hypothetical protein
VLSIARTTDLRDDLTLFSAQVDSQPDSVKGHLYYAKALARRNQHAEAVWELGLAMSGRNHFPGRWQAPPIGREVPVMERLRLLPDLLAPGTPRDRFWAKFRGAAASNLGPEVIPVIDAAARTD